MRTFLQAMLILAVTLILLTMLFAGNLSVVSGLVLIVVLVVLIMVIGGADSQLAPVLQVIMASLQRIFRTGQ
jgi:hypothetical protein